ncbi:hypothetical protein F5879DRAFT_748235 [Lentinula edodes]|nr:hypothetical protein F5879DRAFT_748235 [Lentinula edodes]
MTTLAPRNVWSSCSAGKASIQPSSNPLESRTVPLISTLRNINLNPRNCSAILLNLCLHYMRFQHSTKLKQMGWQCGLLRRVKRPLFCPHSKTECCCLQWLFQQYHELSRCLREEREENEQLIAKNFRQGVRLKRQHEVLEHTVTLLDPSHLAEFERLQDIAKTVQQSQKALVEARKDMRKAQASQREAEDRLEAVNALHCQVLSLLQRR